MGIQYIPPQGGSGSTITLTGNVTGSGTTSISTTIANSAVTLAKIANAAASSKLLGSGSSGSGSPYAEITVGSGLSMTGTTLSATGSGSGDVTGPASSTDNAVTRFDGTTGKAVQNSAVTIDDNGFTTIAVSTEQGLEVTSSLGAGTSENLVYIEATDAAWDRPLLRIVDSSTSGGAANIRIDSPNPDIELIESDQVSPAGKFEIAVQSDIFQINGRNSGDSSFEQILNIHRLADGGMVGIGATSGDVPNARLEVAVPGSKSYFMLSPTVGAASGDIMDVDNSGNLIFNDQGAAVSARFEGDTDTSLLFVDGTNDKVLIGMSSGGLQKLHVRGRAQFGVASDTSGTIDLANSGAAGLTRLSPGAPGSDVTFTFPTTSGTVVTTGDTGSIATAMIANSAVSLAKIANAAASSKLVGSGASGSGAAYTEITVGSGLTMTGTTLSASGGGSGDVVGPGSSTDNAITRFDGTTGKLIQNSSASVDDSGNLTAVGITGTAALVLKYTAITTTTTLDATYYFVDCTSGTFTVTLPTAASIAGRIYVIKNSGTGIITVDGNSTETIDGALTQLLAQYDCISIISDGTNWKVMGRN